MSTIFFVLQTTQSTTMFLFLIQFEQPTFFSLVIIFYIIVVLYSSYSSCCCFIIYQFLMMIIKKKKKQMTIPQVFLSSLMFKRSSNFFRFKERDGLLFFFCDLDRICLTRQLSLFQRNKKETADMTVKLKKANLFHMYRSRSKRFNNERYEQNKKIKSPKFFFVILTTTASRVFLCFCVFYSVFPFVLVKNEDQMSFTVGSYPSEWTGIYPKLTGHLTVNIFLLFFIFLCLIFCVFCVFTGPFCILFYFILFYFFAGLLW